MVMLSGKNKDSDTIATKKRKRLCVVGGQEGHDCESWPSEVPQAAELDLPLMAPLGTTKKAFKFHQHLPMVFYKHNHHFICASFVCWTLRWRGCGSLCWRMPIFGTLATTNFWLKSHPSTSSTYVTGDFMGHVSDVYNHDKMCQNSI